MRQDDGTVTLPCTGSPILGCVSFFFLFEKSLFQEVNILVDVNYTPYSESVVIYQNTRHNIDTHINSLKTLNDQVFRKQTTMISEMLTFKEKS